MKLFIPTIGTKIELTENWYFTLHEERRNSVLWKAVMGKEIDRWDCHGFVTTLLPAGTVLSISRIYIRQGLKGFDSISFIIKSCPNKKMKGRFWAKLEDVNKIEFETVK